MSTPISQLPKQVNPQTISTISEDDPAVSDVILQMEKEFTQHNLPTAAAPAAPPPTQAYSHPPVIPPPQVFSQLPQPPVGKPFIDTAIAKRATICAIVALVMFYPFETGVIYTKIPMLANMQPYERAVRAILLAITIYGIMWKFDI